MHDCRSCTYMVSQKENCIAPMLSRDNGQVYRPALSIRALHPKLKKIYRLFTLIHIFYIKRVSYPPMCGPGSCDQPLKSGIFFKRIPFRRVICLSCKQGSHLQNAEKINHQLTKFETL